MNADQKIITKIGQLLWSIMPMEAEKMIFEGFLYKDWPMFTCYWEQDSTRIDFKLGEAPNEVEDEILSLSQSLRGTSVFQNNRFNHIRISLSDNQKINLQVRTIDREDSWPGLFMRGVSELTEEEATKKICYMPKEEWEKRVKKFGV